MNNIRIEKTLHALLLAFIILLLAILFPTRANGFEVNMDLAPHIINMSGNMETFVIHTNIAYGIVDPHSVTLNGDENYIYGWKMDSLGNFDAIILLSDIADTLVTGEDNVFLLKGLTWEGEPFWAVDELLVIEKALHTGKL